MPSNPGPAIPGETNLGRQSSVYEFFFDGYTGGAATPTQVTAGYVITDGIGGGLYWDLWENNVAAGGAIIIEGADEIAEPGETQFWSPVGYYTIVANGVTSTSLARSQGAVTLTQNTFTKLQMLDAYAFMRARVTANASSASLSALLYALPG